MFINFPALLIKISTELNLLLINLTALFIELESERSVLKAETLLRFNFDKIAEFGWLIIEVNSSIPNIPKLETVNVLPCISSGDNFLSLAFEA